MNNQQQSQSCHKEGKSNWSMYTICLILLGIGALFFTGSKLFNWNVASMIFFLPALLCVGSHVLMMKFMGHDHGVKK